MLNFSVEDLSHLQLVQPRFSISARSEADQKVEDVREKAENCAEGVVTLR